jgi:four helix bundle protein
MQDFHRLKVWQKAHALAIDLYRLSEEFPRRDAVALTSQLRRAALSVPTNIAEGAGKLSNAEFRRFLEIALGSASETLYHLLVARDIGLIEPERHDEFSNRAVEVRRMLSGLIERVRTKHAGDAASSRKAQEPPEAAPMHSPE